MTSKSNLFVDIWFDISIVYSFLYACRKTGRIMEWPCLSVRPSTIACERDILKPLVVLCTHFDMALKDKYPNFEVGLKCIIIVF